MAYFDAVSASAPIFWWQMVPTYFTGTSHRYWRLNMLGNQGGSYFAFSEMRFATSTGGPNILAPTSTIGSSSQFSAATVGTCSVDNLTATLWASRNTTLPQWISWDAGVGNAVEVKQVQIVGRETAFINQSPLNFDIQWSDDTVLWFSYWNATSSVPFTQYMTQTFLPSVFQTGFYIANDGTGSSLLTGNFNPFRQATVDLVMGSATLSNPAYNSAVQQSSAFYSATPTAGYALITNRTHVFDWIWPFDPANYGKAWTLEWWMKYPRYVANSATAILGFGGYDVGNEGISIFAQPAVGSYDAARSIGMSWALYSGSISNYSYGFPGPTWIQYGMNDQEWYHCALVVTNQSATTGVPGVPGGPGVPAQLSFSLGDGNINLWVNGHGVWPQTSAGTWATISGNAGNNYFNRAYSGGMRFWVGNSSVNQFGNPAGQMVYVQQVALYDRALGPEEILGHYMSTRRMLDATGTLFSEAPIYSVQLPMRDVITQTTGSSGARDPRATKTNPGSN